MNIRKTFLAAALGALPFCAAVAAVPMMGAPVAQSPERDSALLTRLTAQRSARGLDNDHNFKIASQHPGSQGSLVTRVRHTYKGVPVFGSESVIVTDAAG